MNQTTICLNNSATGDWQIFSLNIFQSILGFVALIAGILIFFTIDKLSNYHTNVRYLLKCAYFFGCFANGCIFVFGTWQWAHRNTARLVNNQNLNRQICLIFLSIYAACSQSPMYINSVILFERYFAMRKKNHQDIDKPETSIKIMSVICPSVAFLSRFLLMTDYTLTIFWQFDDNVCYCSRPFFPNKNLNSYLTILMTIYQFLSLAFCILLYVENKKLYNSFNSLSSEHDLQERYQTKCSINSMRTLIVFLVLQTTSSIPAMLISIMKHRIYGGLDNSFVYSPNVNYVSFTVISIICDFYWIFSTETLRKVMCVPKISAAPEINLATFAKPAEVNII